MTNFNPNIQVFIDRMAQKNDFGAYLILGKEKSGKTAVLHEYLQHIPDDVRKMVITENIELFQNSSKKSNITSMAPEKLGGTAPSLIHALRMRQSVIAIDDNKFLKGEKVEMLQALESLALASATGNTAITLKHETLEAFIEYINEMFESNEGSLTKMGFVKRIKGITIVESIEAHNVEHRVFFNLMVDGKTLEVLLSKNSIDLKVKALTLLSKQQGNPTAIEQISPNASKGINKASQLILRDFIENNTTGIVVVAGGAGSGKTSLLKGFIRDNYSRGLFGAVMVEDNLEYHDLIFDNHACASFSTSEEDEKFRMVTASSFTIDYIVFDEINSVDELAYALKLSETYRVFIGLHAHNHYHALDRMTWILEKKETLEKLLPSVHAIFKVNRKRDDQLANFRFTADPLILDDGVRKNITILSNFDGHSNAANKFLDGLVAEQGF